LRLIQLDAVTQIYRELGAADTLVPTLQKGKKKEIKIELTNRYAKLLA
jgi:hypothetical protein